MPRNLTFLLLGVAAAGMATTGIAMSTFAPQPSYAQQSPQPPPVAPSNYYDPSNVLGSIPKAIPPLIIGICALLVLGSFFGFYELSLMSVVGLLLVIGGVVYKFYYLPYHP